MADRRLRIAYVLPGFCSDDDDPCIPVITTFMRRMSRLHDVSVYTAEYPYRPGSYTVHGIPVHCTGAPQRNRIDQIAAWKRVGDKIRKDHNDRPFDLIHGFWATLPGYVATRTARALGIPSIVSLAGGELARFPDQDYGSGLHRSSRWIVDRSLKGATHITSGSEWLSALVPESYRTKLSTISLGIEPDRFAAGEIRRGKRILAVAAMIPIKDYSTLIRAYADLRMNLPDASLTCIGWNGNGEERKRIEELIAACGLEKKVTIRGEVHHAAMAEEFRSHDLFVHSSRYEAQGMAILEAMATGMPVVAASVGIVPELPEKLVRSVQPGDVRALSETMSASLMAPQHAESAAAVGPEFIRSHFHAADVAERFSALYERNIRRR